MAIEWHLIYFAIGLPAEILNLANILGQYSGLANGSAWSNWGIAEIADWRLAEDEIVIVVLKTVSKLQHSSYA